MGRWWGCKGLSPPLLILFSFLSLADVKANCSALIWCHLSAQTRLKLAMMMMTMIMIVTVTVRVNHVDGDHNGDNCQYC